MSTYFPPIYYQKNHLMFYTKLFFVALAIFGARLYFIDQYASPVPFWDDWRIPRKILLPWMENAFDWSELIAFHEFNPLFFTRLSSLLLFILNNHQWDVVLGMSVSALMVTLSCLLLIVMAKRSVRPVHKNILLLAVILLWITPNSWGYLGNILWNIETCWYFLLFFSLATIHGLLFHASFSMKWWIGVMCSFFAFLSSSGGFTILLAITIFKLYLLIVDSGKRLNHLPTVIVGLSGVAIQVFLTKLATVLPPVTNIAFFPFLQATSAGLAWPQTQTPWLSLVIYLPFIFLLLKLLTNRRIPSSGEAFVLVLGGWVILMTMTFVYGRGVATADRYFDIYPFGVVANFLAFYLLIPFFPKKLRLLGIGYAVLIWSPVVLSGLYQITINNLVTSYSGMQTERVERLKNTREFISGNMTALDNRPYVPVPGWVLEETKALLVNPTVQSFLPHQLTVPKLLEPTPGSSSFIVNGFHPAMKTYQKEKVLGSYIKETFYDFFGNADKAIKINILDPNVTRIQDELYTHPTNLPANLTYSNIFIPEDASLVFGVSVKNTQNGVKCIVLINGQPVFDKVYQTASEEKTVSIPLQKYYNQSVTVSFIVDPLGNNAFDWIYWVAPKIFRMSEFSLSEKARFESEFISIHQRFMEIPIAGYLGEKGLSLQLFVEGEDKPIEIIPPKLAKETWVSTYIRTPTRPWLLLMIILTRGLPLLCQGEWASCRLQMCGC